MKKKRIWIKKWDNYLAVWYMREKKKKMSIKKALMHRLVDMYVYPTNALKKGT